MTIDRMVIIHDGDCDGSNEGESPIRVGKALTSLVMVIRMKIGIMVIMVVIVRAKIKVGHPGLARP